MILYHEGCGVRITVLHEGLREELLLGQDCARGQRAMARIPNDAIFSAENLAADGYTFVSCVTAPEFRCEDLRLVPDREIRERLEQG